MPAKNSAVNFIHVPESEMRKEFARILKNYRFTDKKAELLADIFTNNSVEGIYTHGVNRFPRFIQYIRQGAIKVDGEIILKHRGGCMEQWDGASGPGPLNALAATDRAMEIARKQGMGAVFLANTNHWMRGGTYGWRAARMGFGFIGWTNTMANMPAWGAKTSKLGNNPLVMALPFQEEAIVLDMAMSQYSYGALEFTALKGKSLEVFGGYDEKGELSRDPGAILKTQRTLPVGYWKGAGLSLLLDILATVFSGGLSTAAVSKLPAEQNLSQVFLVFQLGKLGNFFQIEETIKNIISDYQQVELVDSSAQVIYPGERIVKTRAVNLQKGIPVLEKIWREIQAMP